MLLTRSTVQGILGARCGERPRPGLSLYESSAAIPAATALNILDAHMSM